MQIRLAFLFLLLGISSLAQAQVYRCEDAKGKVNYSDTPCIKGQDTGLIERKKTEAEILRERNTAAQANQQRQAQENAKLKRREQEQSISLKEQQAATSAANSVNLANTPACARARKDMDWIQNIQTLSDEQRRARMNSAISQVNAACGTNTELIQEPAQIVTPGYQNCYNGNCYNPQGVLVPAQAPY